MKLQSISMPVDEQIQKDLLFVQDCDWDLVNPCNDCPFMKLTEQERGRVAILIVEADRCIRELRKMYRL